MRVVVTGGAGFIGSHVADAMLSEGHHVLVIDDLSTGDESNLAQAWRTAGDRLAVERMDINDPGAIAVLRSFKPEAMLLLAAQMSVKVSMRDPETDTRVNVLGLVHMVEIARSVGCRKVVVASSGSIYGQVEGSALPIPETHPRRPESFYALSKSLTADYLELYRRHFGLEFAALALGNVYGPRQNPEGEAGVVAIFGRRILAGLPCVVNGDGLTTRDYVHVQDVAQAFRCALHRGQGLINIGTGREMNVMGILDGLAAASGSVADIRFGPALPGEQRRICLDPRRARSELKWEAHVDLEDGLRNTLNHLRSVAAADERSIGPNEEAHAPALREER